MLNYVNRVIVFIFLIALVSCSDENEKKKNKERNDKIVELSNITIGGHQEYEKIRQQALDSLNSWCNAELLSYRSICYSRTYRLDSTVCFNGEKDRMVKAIYVKCNDPSGKTEDVSYFWGVKVNGKGYFFGGGGTMVVLREHYQKDIHQPVSFEKLHELAMEDMLRGYIKQNEAGQWEVNDAFFTHHFEGNGWSSFERYQDTVVYGKRYTSKKEYFEDIYLRKVASKWWFQKDK